jgi:hypothetical protein
MSDAEIIERLASDEDLVFLTQDLEFESLRIIRGGQSDRFSGSPATADRAPCGDLVRGCGGLPRIAAG